MPPIPDIKGPDRQKPLCYDPSRGKFITLDDLISGKERIVPLESLSEEQRKKLVVERNRVGRDYTVSPLTGPKHSRDDVVKEIENETEFGKMAVQAEISYLSDLLREMEPDLP